MSHIVPAWLKRAYVRSQVDQAVRDAVKILKEKDFDTIAVCGVSGLLIGPILAYRMKKELIVVRKALGAHSQYMTEGYDQSKRYIIVDDVVSSGATVRRMIEAVCKFTRQYQYDNSGGQTEGWTSSVLAGIYCYGHPATDWAGWFEPSSPELDRRLYDEHKQMATGLYLTQRELV